MASTLNWSTVDQSLEALDFLAQQVHELATHFGFRFSPGSQADCEVQQWPVPARLEEAYVHGSRQYLFVARDHMLALRNC